MAKLTTKDMLAFLNTKLAAKGSDTILTAETTQEELSAAIGMIAIKTKAPVVPKWTPSVDKWGNIRFSGVKAKLGSEELQEMLDTLQSKSFAGWLKSVVSEVKTSREATDASNKHSYDTKKANKEAAEAAAAEEK